MEVNKFIKKWKNAAEFLATISFWMVLLGVVCILGGVVLWHDGLGLILIILGGVLHDKALTIQKDILDFETYRKEGNHGSNDYETR